ncbi:putative FBD-associated F-box protein [Spatholobus suberectus]|nr:putative FBD-associated F-box protein [Spatholobus suberectus]
MKRQRQSRRNRDNISQLPDCILLHIMSSMDTKSAVRTCVLSKRWKDLCKRLTNLTFSFSVGWSESFRQFVSWVLSSRDHSYSLLNLAIDSYMCRIEPEFVDWVVKYALFHNVQQLKVDIFVDRANSEFLPSNYCCRSLKFLELSIKKSASSVLILPKSLYMPALKSLYLSYVRFTTKDNEYAEPFSNCHMLNTLVLRHFSLHNDEQVLCISNPTLSSLTIFEGQASQIGLSTPNLRSFTIKGSVRHQLFSTCSLSFLGEVNIFIYGDATSWDGRSSIILKWLEVLANVKTLTFSLRAFRVMLHDLSNPSSMRPQPPCFARLESLKVKKQLFANISDDEVNRVVKYLLQNSPMARVDIITNA